MKKLFSSLRLATLAALSVSTLAGCELYFGEADDEPGRPGGPVEPGFACQDDADCAAGCYCETAPGQSAETGGTCVEAGFCSTDADCGEGFICDDRNSCVPVACDANNPCPTGSVCNDLGQCEETCVCTSDTQAQDAGFGYCDEATSTCQVGADPAGTCLGAITCNEKAPNCAEGEVPLIKDGCYTGLCRAIAQCEGVPVCESYQHENDCEGANASGQSCQAVSVGTDCTTPTGEACQAGTSNCTCANFRFDECRTVGN